MQVIDISIVTYNSSKWLAAFFESLLNQDYPAKLLNIYIRDNSSSDDTLTQLENIKSLYQNKFGLFDISQGPNKGFGFGHNRNFEKGQANYFLVTNVDLIFEKNAIIELLNYIHPDFASFELRQKPYEHPKYYNPITLETNWSSSACILFKRDAFKKINGYEERIFLYGEDVDISYRLRDAGYKLKYCPRAVCWHYSYEHENELKPSQFFGSTLANVYLRLRFGNSLEIIMGYMMYLALFFIPIKLPNRLKNLWKNFILLLKNTPYFIKTRKKSNIKFIFKKWDYDIRRTGDFYKNKALPENPPLVSVIIRTYQGRLEWLKEAVASVLNQTYSTIELIIIEDGSQTAKNIFPTAVYNSIQKSGRSVAGNKGLEIATGEYIVFLDDDDLFFADHIEVLVTNLLENPSAGAAYSIAWQVPTDLISLSPLCYKTSEPQVIYQQKFSRYLLWDHNYLPIQSVLFKRKLYLENGGFDLTLDALEDWDLWIRYSLNHDFVFVEKLTSLYRVPSALKIAFERQKILDAYRSIVVNKQKSLGINNRSTPSKMREILMKSFVLYAIYRLLLKKYRWGIFVVFRGRAR